MTAQGQVFDDAIATLAGKFPDRYAFEIVKNFRFAPADKIALEYGKVLLAAGRRDDAEAALVRITRHLNANWRAVYRAFCILSRGCSASEAPPPLPRATRSCA